MNDIDLAIWVTDLSHLTAMRKTISSALNGLIGLNAGGGVARHHFDVHLFEPRTGRYRGRLCHFAQCPKAGKMDCLVPGCGAQPFLRQLSGYEFDFIALSRDRCALLFSRTPSPPEEAGEVPF